MLFMYTPGQVSGIRGMEYWNGIGMEYQNKNSKQCSQ